MKEQWNDRALAIMEGGYDLHIHSLSIRKNPYRILCFVIGIKIFDKTLLFPHEDIIMKRTEGGDWPVYYANK